MNRILLNDLRNVRANITGHNLAPVEGNLKPSFRKGLRDAEKNYREEIIETNYSENLVVQNSIEGKLRFSEVGEPIIIRANEIYENVKDSKKGYKFRAKEILEHPSCVESVEQLKRVVNLKSYFKNKRIFPKKVREVSEKLVPENRLFILSELAHGFGGGAFGYYILDSGLAAFGWGVAGTCLFFGEIVASENTPESLIKKPAEKLGEDLIFLDETFDRIYRGGERE